MDELQLESLRTIKSLPQGLYDDVAKGAASVLEIFQSYGLDADTCAQFRNDPVFVRLVAVRRRELSETGDVAKSHAAFLSDLSEQELVRRVTHPDTPTSVVLDIYKHSSKLAGREKGLTSDAPQGTGFSIIVNPPTPRNHEKDITPPESIPIHVMKFNEALAYSD